MKGIVALLLAVLLLGSSEGCAQQLSSEEIRCRLDPTCPKIGVRGLPFRNRGVTVSEEKQESPNSINFHVTFAYDSAELQNDSLITLNALGKALADPSMQKYQFVIAGHTDARGSDEYNLRLSERRAQAVSNYLVAVFKIERSRLLVKGYGKQQRYDASRPEDQINRRVQVVTVVPQSESATK